MQRALQELVGRGRRAVAPRSVVSHVRSAERVVALTYDDGPNPNNTLPIVRLLDEHAARATFFVIGSKIADGRADIVAETAAAGHEIANHTWSHDPAVLADSGLARADIARASAAIEEAAGRPPQLFRPPFGKRIRPLAAAAESLGLRTVLWSVDAGDWRDEPPQDVAERIVRHVRPGTIVLMHDSGPPRPSVVEATARALDGLVRRHYLMLTVSELLAVTADAAVA